MKRGLSFALFDVGETVLGALVFSTFFPLYITRFIDTKVYSLLYGLSFLFSFLVALNLGKLADRRALRKHLFVASALGAALLCGAIAVAYEKPMLALLLFLSMAVFHQQALVFYNSLLLSFESRGGVSGLGVSFGYIGSALALLFLAQSLKEPGLYLVVALIYLLFFIPSAVAIPNPSQSSREVSVKAVLKDRRFLLLILAVLSITEVANTLIAMMGIYLREVYSLERVEIYRVIGTSALGGVIGGVFWGLITDSLGVRRVFPAGFLFWIVFLLLLSLTPKSLIVPAGFLAGFSLAHIWTTSRLYILEEFPQQEASLRLSFLSLTERVASMSGLLIWSFFLFMTQDNYRLSALLMVCFPLAGFVLYRKFVYPEGSHGGD